MNLSTGQLLDDLVIFGIDHEAMLIHVDTCRLMTGFHVLDEIRFTHVSSPCNLR